MDAHGSPAGARRGGASAERWASLAIVGVATVLANLAWGLGWLAADEAHHLSGLHTLNSADTPSYLAWIDQARRGHMTFGQLFTTEPHPRALFNPLFLAIGAAARVLGASNVEAYHGARIVLGALAGLASVAFVRTLLPRAAWRVCALTLLWLAAGLGWIVALWGAAPPAWPLDLWEPAAVPFLGLVESPQYMASLALWAGLGASAFRFLRGGGRGALMAACGAAALLACLRPHAGAPPAMALAWAGAGVLAWRHHCSWRRSAACALALSTAILVGLVPPWLALESGPAFAGWRQAASGAAPALPVLVLGMFWPLLLAALGARPALREAEPAALWLGAWIATTLSLIYLPVGPQVAVARKLVEALPLPVATLGGVGLAWVLGLPEAVERWSRRHGARLVLAAAIAFPSNARLLALDAQAFLEGRVPQVLPSCLVDAFDWLALHGAPEDVVLAPPSLGAVLPGFTGHRVVCCHYDQTLDRPRKMREVRRFYSPGPAPRRTLIERYRVRFVVYAGGQTPGADLRGRLERRFASRCAAVYEVVETPGSGVGPARPPGATP